MSKETSVGTAPERLIRRMNIARPILDSATEKLRNQVLVVDSLSVKGHPSAKEETNLQGARYDGDEYVAFDALTRERTYLEIGDADPVRLLDKTYPHGLKDMMIMQSSRSVKPSVCDLEPGTQGLCFGLMREFAGYANASGLYPYIAYSYDPKTNDRETGQGVKRFHAHLVGRTPEELNFIQNNAKPLANLDRIRARRLVDESSIIASSALCDRLATQQLSSLDMVRPLMDENNPMPNAMFRLKRSWDTLAQDDFRADFNLIHQNVLATYADVMDGFWQGTSGYWQRPQMRSRDDIVSRLEGVLYLSGTTQGQLRHVLQHIQPSLLTKTHIFNSDRYRDVATHVYPINGPCYSTSFCEIDGDVYCTVRPYMFSDLGGAGVGNPLGIVTKVKKGVGVMSPDEMNNRHAFQKGFVRRIESLK